MTGRDNNRETFFACPVCRGMLDQRKVFSVLDQKEKTIFHVSCGKCRSSALILFSSGAKGAWGMGVATDLTREEAREKLAMKKISADEVIEFYENVNNIK